MVNNFSFIGDENNKFVIAYDSGVGKRESQQDKGLCIVDKRGVYAVICDGMGGLGSGELASQVGIENAIEYYSENRTSKTNTWLIKAILDANAKVSSIRDVNGELAGCGSTLVSLRIVDNSLFWAAVGDSRIYIFADNQCVQLTTDLNYQYYIDNVLNVSGEKIDSKENPEALISYLGVNRLEYIDRNDTPLHTEKGDIILLCSDGVYKTIDESWMLDIINSSDNIHEVANMFSEILSTNEDECQDNYTFVFIEIFE